MNSNSLLRGKPRCPSQTNRQSTTDDAGAQHPRQEPSAGRLGNRIVKVTSFIRTQRTTHPSPRVRNYELTKQILRFSVSSVRYRKAIPCTIAVVYVHGTPPSTVYKINIKHQIVFVFFISFSTGHLNTPSTRHLTGPHHLLCDQKCSLL